MNGLSRYAPWVVAALAVFFLVMVAFPERPRSGEMNFQELGQIPVVHGGRVKPIDTLARVSLKVISGRETFRDTKDKEQPAVRWLLDVWTSGQDEALKYKVFRIDNDQVLQFLGLEARPGSYRYALDEFADKMDQISAEASRAEKIDQDKQSVFDRKILELAQRLQLYVNLAKFKVPNAIPPESDGEEWKTVEEVNLAAGRQAALELREELEKEKKDPAQMKEDELWDKLQARMDQIRRATSPATVAFLGILNAYRGGNADRFNKAVADYRQHLTRVSAADRHKAEFEVWFNHFAPFYCCAALYVVAFLVSSLSWMTFHNVLRRSAFWLLIVTLLVHTWALGTRMYIQGRPPVTNLYSTAVFVGWVGLVLALVLETIFRNGLGNVVASLIGFPTMVMAHFLAGSGDTMEMMQAVLDTNFWLATHVVIINAGYGATLVTGILGIVFVLLGVFTPTLRDRDFLRAISWMIYGVLCFATLFSFVGTVLGGIWADYSWGRFWGWDPKENGALMIVLWNALILHARWAGMVKQRGVAVLAIAGNMVTAWSWFGTNQLGVGLHAYGFNSSLSMWLTIFWGSQLVFILIGLLPTSWWWSFAPVPAAAAAPVARAGRKAAAGLAK